MIQQELLLTLFNLPSFGAKAVSEVCKNVNGDIFNTQDLYSLIEETKKTYSRIGFQLKIVSAQSLQRLRRLL